MAFTLGSRRGIYVDITDELKRGEPPVSAKRVKLLEEFDLFYRTLCTLLFNYVPVSGHPGGSISAGRFLATLLLDSMDYDISRPERDDADIISFAAGHKTMGLYSLWAMRNEALRIAAPKQLPAEERFQLRLEDLLGFRRNPIARTPLIRKFNARTLDGHPTPATPFVRLSTGASGVGMGSSIGLALGAIDYYGANAPKVHIVEGEGGLTPGRVSEAMAAAGTASLGNVILHVDWNQASIDSSRVCREDGIPGDYVQWTPAELAYFHDWNVIVVPDGKDWQQISAAQKRALSMDNGQPTAVVYRTVKGWLYGIEGKGSHGAGHKLCADGFFETLKPFTDSAKGSLPRCKAASQRCRSGNDPAVLEACFWESLTVVRKALEGNRPLVAMIVESLAGARRRLDGRKRKPRAGGPRLDTIYEIAARSARTTPKELLLTPGTATTLRAECGRVLSYYNRASGGALFGAAADLLGSTSLITVGQGFPGGYYNAATNPGSRLLTTGGICEDAMTAILSGLASFGHHTGAGSSYGAFLAPLGHIAARLHAIANQARQSLEPGPYRPIILVCAHAGIKTGEDGPTHADVQPLQVLQENFPRGTMVTLTPLDPQELWPLMATALNRRPAVIAPFVTRPTERVIDREALGLPPAAASVAGVTLLRKARKKDAGVVVLQGSEVGYAFVEETLPLLEKKGIDLFVYYVASAELFDLLPRRTQAKIFPEEHAGRAMGITGFTLPTMYRWIRSDRGREMTLHPFRAGHYLGSGQAHMVLAEAGLDGKGQFKGIMKYLKG
ncbi:MAG: transketolase family protein [Syntrophales bacterium]